MPLEPSGRIESPISLPPSERFGSALVTRRRSAEPYSIYCAIWSKTNDGRGFLQEVPGGGAELAGTGAAGSQGISYNNVAFSWRLSRCWATLRVPKYGCFHFGGAELILNL